MKKGKIEGRWRRDKASKGNRGREPSVREKREMKRNVHVISRIMGLAEGPL